MRLLCHPSRPRRDPQPLGARGPDEIRRRVAQGHREIVLTGVNLGCFRDREAALTLAGLIRAAGTIDGLERLRLSSIEINHVTPELIAAMRETPVVSRHLHVPLQSGDDGVLRAMGRRYTIGQYRSRLEPLEEFNLTSDVIVGFPTEDERAFESTMAAVAAVGITKVHVFPYSPRPGTRTAAADPVSPEVKKERSARLRSASDAACVARWSRRIGSDDVVLVDRPGLGYATTTRPGSSPHRSVRWCRPGPSASRTGGWSPLSQPDCLFCRLVAGGDHVHVADGFVAVRDIAPAAETHLLVLPERHVDTFRDVGAFPDEEAGRMLRFVAEVAAAEGLDDYRVIVNVGPGGGQTVFHLHWHVLGGNALPGFH